VQKKLILSLLLLALLTGCASSQNIPTPALREESNTENPPPSQPPTEESQREIRYALLAPSTDENIWSLFDENGASYENYASQGANYPRLYELISPTHELTPLLADGFPSPFVEDGEYFVSTISLLPDLQWDDGTPLTAEDIVFTINTALAFQLGLNWAEFYNPEKLHHAEALDPLTIKYYFSSPPNAGDWQHGALIGIFANKTYWEAKIINAQSFLPTTENDPLIINNQIALEELQIIEKNILEAMKNLEENSTEYRKNKLLLDQNITEQSVLQNKIDNAQQEKRDAFIAARAALYALPTSQKTPTENYHFYERAEAVQALFNNEIDFILSPQPLSLDEIEKLSKDPTTYFAENRRNDIRFLTFNHHKKNWGDVALRRAISCLIDPETLANEKLDERVIPALGWVAPENTGWHSSIISPPCAGMDADARLAEGIRTLQKAGYAWLQTPSPNHAGSELLLPSGEEFPAITIFAPEEDSSRTEAASYITEVVQRLGIPVEQKNIPTDELFYKVYGTNDYDLAIIGWSLSLYPDYLCDFFAAENPYNYSNAAVDESCNQFLEINDPALAREKLFEIEILLWDDLPAIPLFSSKITEAYRNIYLPFGNYLGGFAPTLYGVPNSSK
jgi:peptide/nickel transport system substrate-binding protein